MPGAKKDKKKGAEDDVPVILKGTYMFANGDRYEGEYLQLEDGSIERSGTGSHFTADGQHFQGIWVADKMDGQGRMELPSGASYEGDFVNNQYHGNGKYTWPNGSLYEGQFVENRMEGDGEFSDTDSQIWTGTFRYKAAPGLRFKMEEVM